MLPVHSRAAQLADPLGSCRLERRPSAYCMQRNPRNRSSSPVCTQLRSRARGAVDETALVCGRPMRQAGRDPYGFDAALGFGRGLKGQRPLVRTEVQPGNLSARVSPIAVWGSSGRRRGKADSCPLRGSVRSLRNKVPKLCRAGATTSAPQ